MSGVRRKYFGNIFIFLEIFWKYFFLKYFFGNILEIFGKEEIFFEEQPAIVYAIGGEIRRVPASIGNPVLPVSVHL
jgi:hypothetical protein